jgi:signal transduction histidine kinase
MRVRVLTFRYVGALSVVAGLLIADQAIVQHALDRQEGDARVVNMAGRQRMLGQRLCMLLLAVGVERAAEMPGTLDELERVADEWERSQAALRAGRPQTDLAIANPDLVAELFAQIEADHRVMLAAARAARITLPGSASAIDALTALAHQDAFLAGMDRIVAEYERDARRRVVDLRRLELALLALALVVLALEGAFVFRPVVRDLRAHLAARDVAQRALEISEAEKHAILRAFPDRLLVMSRDGSCVEIHADRIPPAPRRLTEALPGELAAACLARADATLPTGTVARFAIRVEPYEYEARLLRLPDDRLLIVIRDITETAHLERQLLHISDREQMRLAQDLHDGLSQQLVGISFLLRSLRRDGGGDSVDRVDEIAKLLAEAIEQARGLARGLHSHTLEAAGFAAALDELAAHTERVFGVECRVTYLTDRFDPPAPDRMHLHRIAREAVLNAAKHADATLIEIEIARDDSAVTLVVRDDGVGIGDHPPDGMGLHLMAYRARMMGASLQIAAGEHRGTTVTCNVPLRDRSAPGVTA